MDSFSFQIGHLVALINHPYFKKENNDYKYIGTGLYCSSDNYPLMLIKECTKSIQKEQVLDIETSEVSEKNYLEEKFLCTWYDSDLGKFQEAWFRKDFLVLFPDNLMPHIRSSKELLTKTVYLKTTIIERYKKIQNQGKQNDRFVSSSFVIKEFKNETQYEWINDKLKFCEKLITQVKVKVQWFNVKHGKYSEEWLPIEFFQETPQLFDYKERTILNNESEYKFGDKLMNLLSDNNYNYNPFNSEEGLSLENLIFYYLKSKQKIILDDRVYSFDKYLKENNYSVEKYKIHLNSIGMKEFKEFYSQLDLLLQNKKTKQLVAIDIISGNGLFSDEKLVFNPETQNEEQEPNQLSLYKERAFIVEKLLNEKYKMENITSKLLIINSKLKNFIKEIDVLICEESLKRVASS